MSTSTILVTGATGNVGRPLVGGLLADGARVRALTRDPVGVAFPPGVAVVGGDYAAPGTLAEAVRGADAVFVNIGALREHAGELISAARGTGVSKIVMLSSIAVRDEGDQVLFLGRQHKAVEDAVKAAGVDWTILRCGGFATNTLTWAASVRAEGVVRFPYGEAALAPIAEQDIAAAAVRVLLDSGHAGRTYVLTGAESLTQIQQAEAIGKAIGRPVRFEELSPGQFRPVATRYLPAPVVEDLLKALAGYVGQAAYMTADLEKIIGRPATSYTQWAAMHADAYR